MVIPLRPCMTPLCRCFDTFREEKVRAKGCYPYQASRKNMRKYGKYHRHGVHVSCSPLNYSVKHISYPNSPPGMAGQCGRTTLSSPLFLELCFPLGCTLLNPAGLIERLTFPAAPSASSPPLEAPLVFLALAFSEGAGGALSPGLMAGDRANFTVQGILLLFVILNLSQIPTGV